MNSVYVNVTPSDNQIICERTNGGELSKQKKKWQNKHDLNLWKNIMVNFYWIFFTEFYPKVDMKIFLENMPQIAGNHIYVAAVLFQNFVGGGGGGMPHAPGPS